jgi:hypothetical protein
MRKRAERGEAIFHDQDATFSKLGAEIHDDEDEDYELEAA